MRMETASLFGQFAAIGQRKDLETAAVGQDRTVPRAEAVQAARLFEDIRSRTQVKVVGIPQDNLRPDLLLQVTVENPFNAATVPTGIKIGVRISPWSVESTPARAALRESVCSNWNSMRVVSGSQASMQNRACPAPGDAKVNIFPY